ncbi:MAG TPA: cellulase family glycosylhydrolase [Polyangiaceae bacterium]|nr:cellulase family glycosylhydrolase [Polyangiaceae bacterium]
MRTSLTTVIPLILAAVAGACSSESSPSSGQGGRVTSSGGGGAGGTGGARSGGAGGASGGVSGGLSTGGVHTGGAVGVTGGSATAGSAGSGGSVAGAGGSGAGAGGVVAGAGGVAQGGAGAGAGGTAGASTGAGGSLGGSAAGATDLKCNDPIYGSVAIPATAVISDFESSSLKQYEHDGRGVNAEPWYAYAVDDVNDAHGEVTTPSVVNPKNAANNFKVETTEHGPCSAKGALHVSSPGKAGSGSYAGFGIDFMARTAARKKLSYDASKYTGVGFWAKCKSDLQFAYLKVPDAKQDADMDPAPCTYSEGTCNQYGIKNAVLTKEWTYYKIYFSEALQDPNGKNFGTGVDKSKLTAFQIHVNPLSPRNGSPLANPFDCYIDDVHFLTEAAPAVPAATVKYTVSGNQILRNGSPYKIRGLVRPSMEWDYSGFGVTREDMQRMKTKWHANAVRLAVKDTLWKGASTGSATGDGGAYQRNVKRVINWILQQGMDVILDLHYVAGMPTAEHATFWDSISKDAFFKDGRIIFELYNEPTGDFTQLRSWMDSTITKIRANGAENLLLVGGVDYSYDISGYEKNPITGKGAVAYVTHPYIFKSAPGDAVAFLTPAKTLPVVATEFGDANVEGFHTIPATQCVASIYSDYISKFEGAGMSWTSWAWIVDEWGCGFPQIISDYSGTPNSIGTPVQQQLLKLNP